MGLRLILDGFLGWPIAIDGNVELSVERGQALDVIGMLVRDENRGEVFGRPPDSGQALADLAQAEARVNEHAGLVGFHVRGSAGGPAAKDG